MRRATTLLSDDMLGAMRDFQVPYARPGREVRAWSWGGESDERGIHLLEVVRRVHPTLLIGCSASPGAFTEEIIREMAAHAERPVIFALSNPTSLSEAVPSNLIAWTEGRALVATGGPFPPVVYGGTTYTIGQANNALVFPGLGLGAIVARASAVDDLRAVSLHVGVAVARAALEERLARADVGEVMAEVRSAMWEPAYRPVRAV